MSPSRFSISERARRWFFGRIVDPSERWAVAPLRRFKNGARQYRPVFVAGAMGSGTTLLALSLGQEIECAAVINESALRISRESFLRIAPPARFHGVEGFLAQLRERSGWSVEVGRVHLMSLYRSYARGTSDVVIDKGPNTNLSRAGFLTRCFPEGKFILLFRDPVANIEGLRRKWPSFQSDSLAASIDFYEQLHEGFLSVAPQLDDRVATVEYEALVENPGRVLATLRDTLSLPPSTRRPPLRSRENFEGQGIRNVSRGRIHIVRDANQQAYARVDPQTAMQIRKALGPLYQRLRDRAKASGLAAVGDRGSAE